MLLELYGFEESIRARQANIAHEVELYNLHPEAGRLRRFVGTLFVRVGESIRGAETHRGSLAVTRQSQGA
jgi:hypothetical protein